MKTTALESGRFLNAARQGFEPQFLVPETNVLPLDDRARSSNINEVAIILPDYHCFATDFISFVILHFNERYYDYRNYTP